jgi:hypothetical protein
MNNPRPKAIRASNAVKVNTAGWGGNQEESGKRSGKTTLPDSDALFFAGVAAKPTTRF